jgi:GNAT superfamily N-acetyltransferase
VKIFEEALGLLRRYGPTLAAHLVFLVLLSLFVLDVSALPNGAELWARVTGNIDNSLKAVGLSTDRWYVIAALFLAYLTAFEWIRGLVASLPGLRILGRDGFAPDLLVTACHRLKLEPDPWRVSRALRALIERATERVRQNGQSHPYQWMIDREGVFRIYYGTLLIALFAVLAWSAAGPKFAKPGRVWLTLVALAAAAAALRWYIAREYSRRLNQTGYWALEELERAEGEGENRLRREGRGFLLRRAAEERAHALHPATILSRALARLPRRWGEGIRGRIRFPRRERQVEWKLVVSSRSRLNDDPPVPAAALDVRPFASKFTSLLEREGTGLCILVPPRSGLALGAPQEGSAYSFATRSHGEELFGIRLAAADTLDKEGSPELTMATDGSPGFIVAAGKFPLERLVIRQAPDSRSGWSSILRVSRDWLRPESGKANPADAIDLARAVPLEEGGSYVVGVETEAQTVARVALQCFRIANTERLLVSWAFLDAVSRGETFEGVPPFWKPEAWKGLLKSRTGKPRGVEPLNVEVRPLLPEESRTWLDIHHKAVRASAADYPTEVIEAWAPLPITDDQLEATRANPDGEIRIAALSNKTIVGIGAVISDRRELRACYVSPEAAGKGVGRAIVAKLEAIAWRQGARFLTVESTLTAQPFYERLGYKALRRSGRLLPSGVPIACIEMHKRLWSAP